MHEGRYILLNVIRMSADEDAEPMDVESWLFWTQVFWTSTFWTMFLNLGQIEVKHRWGRIHCRWCSRLPWAKLPVSLWRITYFLTVNSVQRLDMNSSLQAVASYFRKSERWMKRFCANNTITRYTEISDEFYWRKWRVSFCEDESYIGWRMMARIFWERRTVCWRTKIEDLDERFGNGRKRCEEGFGTSWRGEIMIDS